MLNTARKSLPPFLSSPSLSPSFRAHFQSWPESPAKAQISPTQSSGARDSSQGLNTGVWGLGFHRGAEKVLITRNRSCPWFDFDGRNLLFVNNFQLSCLHFPCFSFFPGFSRLIHWLILPLSLYSHPFLWFSSSFHERGRIYLSLTLGLLCDLF